MHIANNILKHSLQNVYFLVGTACGGKTTMAKAISQKYGFTYFNDDNWDKPYLDVWNSIITEKYQPNATARREIDWEVYFSRTVEEFLADKKDRHGTNERVEFALIELLKLAQTNKVITDLWIEDWDLLLEIADPSRIA